VARATKREVIAEAERLIELFESVDFYEALDDVTLTASGIERPDVAIRRPTFKEMAKERGWVARSKAGGSKFYRVRAKGSDTLSAAVDHGKDPGEEAPEAAAPEKVEVPVDLDEDFFLFPKEIRTIEKIIDTGMNLLLVGPTGCGKSSMVEELWKRAGIAYRRMNLNGEVTVDDFVGMHEARDGNTFFTDGVLPDCMKNDRRLLIDELDASPAEILFVLQSVLEGKPLVITKNAGEIVKPSAGFRIVATANTIGKGDDTALYQGTNVLNEAFLDRFGAIIHMTYLSAEKERLVLQKRTGIDADTAKKLCEVAGLARKSFESGDLYSTFSTRKLLNTCRLVKECGMRVPSAFKMAVINKVRPEDGTVLAEIFQRIFG